MLEPKPKKRKPGRPKLPKGQAKGTAIQVRLSPETRKRVNKAAKLNKQTVSQWIRATIEAAVVIPESGIGGE